MIVDDDQRAVMEFIATVNQGGYRPTSREINEWRLRPKPRPRQRGKLLEAAVPEVPERRVPTGQARIGSGMLAQMMPSLAALDKAMAGGNRTRAEFAAAMQVTRGLRDAALRLGFTDYETIPGRPGRPARYGPDRPGEKFLAHLRRLGWIERDGGGRYSVALLGHALLRAEASAEHGGEDPSVIVLTADDELAYGRLMGVIAESGDALIMDSYLGAQDLVHLLNHTSASRFLVGTKLGLSRQTQLAVQVSSTPASGEVVRELRQASFHDRYVIGDHKVYGLGSSLNGVGKNMTTLVELSGIVAQTIRAEAESIWSSAIVLAQTQHEELKSPALDRLEPRDTTLSREAPDLYKHPGCAVRHRSRETADRCTNGQ